MPKAKRKAKISTNTAESQTKPPTPHHPPSRFIVDTIFPKHELHIIGGPAHGGKTTLLYQIMSDLQSGYNVLGYQSHPVPFCCISCVHSLEACQTIMDRMDVSFPIFSFVDNPFLGEAEDKPKIDKLEQVCDKAAELVPDLQVIFLDGLQRLFDGSITDNAAVGKFLSSLIRKLQGRDLSMIGTGRAAKPKEATNGSRSIDKFLGATAWTEFSSSFISIEPIAKAGVNDPRRNVTIMPKHSAVSFHHFKFGSTGRLIETVIGDNVPERIDAFAMALLLNREGKPYWTTRELLDLGADYDIPSSTCYRYIEKLVEQGRLHSPKHGYYVIPGAPTMTQ